MTDEELKTLVASLAISSKELIVAQKETDRQLRETDEQIKGLRESQRETSEQISEQIRGLKESQQETDRQLKETDRQLRQQLKELNKQIGGLGNKFGSFTEGMAFPAMKKILQKRFGMNNIAPNYQVKKNGKTLEMDVFAYSNGKRKVAYIVEVKSHLKEDSIQQMLEILEDFPKFLPEHTDKQLYGILAAVNISESMKRRVLNLGIYLANIHDDNFHLQVPEDFKARNFQVVH